jgi:Na+/glutamate symporter
MARWTSNRVALTRLLVGSCLLILGTGAVAYYLENRDYLKTTEKDVKASKDESDPRADPPDLGMIRFLNSGKDHVGWKAVMAGLSYGVVFGFIDNAGLWVGMEALDPYIPGGDLTKAGVGNTYSDLLGATVGTFVSVIMTHVTGIKEAPMWVNTVGIFLGCIVGLVVPRWLTGRS